MQRHQARSPRIVSIAALLAIALIVALAAGPRASSDYKIAIDTGAIAGDAEAYLARREATYPDIRPGLEKRIVWSDPERRQKTPIAIVYLHGFSASQGETRPLSENVAEALGANLYLTRLAGHGRTSDAMAEASVDAWMNDTAEAIAIGRTIGERVVVIGVSTGATLAMRAALDRQTIPAPDALVLISPNFGLNAAGENLLTAPWSPLFVPLVLGAERGFEPAGDIDRRYWTTRYPTRAILPMAALVAATRNAPIETLDRPVLAIFSPEDRVVDAGETERVLARLPQVAAIERIGETGDPGNHVIAGDARSPQTTAAIAERIVRFVEEQIDQP